MFTEYRYRYVVTNLPKSWTTVDVIDATYARCDQEKVIAQLGSGIAAWRNPVAEFAGNCAWLEIARLAWNLGKWVAQLALPAEVAGPDPAKGGADLAPSQRLAPLRRRFLTAH